MNGPDRLVDEALQWITDRVGADLPPDQPVPVLHLDPAFSGVGRPGSGPDPSDAVVDIGANRTRIGLEHGRETACQAVMSAVQDAVVDRTGRPWPEVIGGDGETVGVLDVAVAVDGSASWFRGRDVVAPIGGLVAACESRGWRINP